MQAPEGFIKAGGFKGIYEGISIVAVGSAPGAALFFSTYEFSKKIMMPIAVNNNYSQSLVHMSCASIGEFVSCLSLNN